MDTGISPHGGLAPYVNSVVLNKVVYVPRYGIPEDETALEQWRAAMPGYEVRGYTFSFDKEPHAVRNPRNTGPTGWRDGDVLHCRVRGVFDPRMMHVSVRRPGPENPSLMRVRAEGCGGTRVKAASSARISPIIAQASASSHAVAAAITPMPITGSASPAMLATLRVVAMAVRRETRVAVSLTASRAAMRVPR